MLRYAQFGQLFRNLLITLYFVVVACFWLSQVRVVFLYWLPCILRMSRPTPEEEEEKLDKKAQQLQSVELKERLVLVEGPKIPSRSAEMISDSFICEHSCEWVLFVCVCHFSSSKSLLANVLDIDDDFRCNHSCPTFLQQPTYYRTVYRYWKL